MWYCVVAIEISAGALVNLVLFEPMFAAVLFKKYAFVHPTVCSDIPGNVHAFDTSIISLFRTLPEPSNFNIVWTGVEFGQGLIIRGACPPGRCNSMSVYGQGSADAPKSLDLKNIVDDGKFEVIIAPSTEFGLSCGQWKKGFLAMRNYLVPPGTRVVTPQILRLSDEMVLRDSKVLVAGPTNLVLSTGPYFSAAQRMLVFNLCMVFANYQIGQPMILCCAIMLSSLFFTYLSLKLCYAAGRLRLSKFANELCASPHSWEHCGLDNGSEASQPSTLHEYWLMRYNLFSRVDGRRSGLVNSVYITARINPAYQAYWSIVVYDLYGIPLPQYVFDENVKRIYHKKACAVQGFDQQQQQQHQHGFDDNTNRDYSIRVRICTEDSGPPTASENSSVCPACSSAAHVTTLDVGATKIGYVLFRLVHPTTDLAVKLSAPRCEMEIDLSD